MKLLIAATYLCALPVMATEVKLERVPEDGLQPQVAVEPDGTVHLVYLTGKPGGSDVRYTRRGAQSNAWEPPVTVNSIPESAIAVGTIRGAQIAPGKAGRIHIAWNGAAIRGEHATAPLYYAGSVIGGRSFSPQKVINGGTVHLDGGASIAADAKGGVFVVWHAAPDRESGEGKRRIYVARSSDDGATFAAPVPAGGSSPGVCPCCSLKTVAAGDGSILTLFRNASGPVQRDMALLTSRDGGRTFSERVLQPWPVAACPMSSAAMISGAKSTRAAWETNGTIFTVDLAKNDEPVAISGDKSRHPALAMNSRGETLVTWSIGTGWQRGGEFGWVLLDAAGKPSGERKKAPGVPVWGHTAAFSLPNGDFVILH